MSLFGCVNPHVSHQMLLEIIERSIVDGILLERARYKDGKEIKSMTQADYTSAALKMYRTINFTGGNQ